MDGIVKANGVIYGVDVWIIEHKREYVLNSEDKIELSGFYGWTHANSMDDSEIPKKVKGFLKKTELELKTEDIAFGFVLH